MLLAAAACRAPAQAPDPDDTDALESPEATADTGAARGTCDPDIDSGRYATPWPGTECDCKDGVDEDRDGLVDCEDGDCFDDPACIEGCDDGLDGDGDGAIDCADDDCWGLNPYCHPQGIRVRVLGGRLAMQRNSLPTEKTPYWSWSSAWAVGRIDLWSVRGSVSVLPANAQWDTTQAPTRCAWSFAHGGATFTSSHSWTHRFNWYTLGHVTRTGLELEPGCRLDHGWLPRHLVPRDHVAHTAWGVHHYGRYGTVALGTAWYTGIVSQSTTRTHRHTVSTSWYGYRSWTTASSRTTMEPLLQAEPRCCCPDGSPSGFPLAARGDDTARLSAGQSTGYPPSTGGHVIPALSLAAAAVAQPVLVSTGDEVAAYTRSGTWLDGVAVPHPSGVRPAGEGTRDLAVLAGEVVVYNGTLAPSLSTYAPSTGSWSHTGHSGWGTAAAPHGGGIAVHGAHVYATDQSTCCTPDDALGGVVRFDTASGGSVRYAAGVSYLDVDLGRDGLLYALRADERTVDQVDPLTLAPLAAIVLERRTRSVAVDATGVLWGTGSSQTVSAFSPTGAELGLAFFVAPGLVDIAVAADGLVAVGSGDGQVVLYEPSEFVEVGRFSVGVGPVFVAFP